MFTNIDSQDLKNLCRNASNTASDMFVGIKFDWLSSENRYDISINFPLGYRISSDNENVRKDILLLIKILNEYKDKESIVSRSNLVHNDKISTFPIQAYLNVIQDFIKRNGYYTEKDEMYVSRSSGKVNWNRTIRKEKPIVQKNGIAYLNLQVRKNNDTDKNLITEINKFCVYESFLKIGWLYKSILPAKPTIKFNKSLFISQLKFKLANTNKDEDKLLFKDMLDIVNFLDDTSQGNESQYFGTYNFQYIWEQLIDLTFGIVEKQLYFPRATWSLYFSNDRQSSALQPDTILKQNDICVLDAKYYKYGETGLSKDLPNSSSINKQITYGEYIANNYKQTSAVYNAFLMPFNKDSEIFATVNDYLVIGKANSDWKKNENSYEVVLGILVDIKHLMSLKTRPNLSEISLLVNAIRDDFKHI
ncbi:Type II restriction-modification system restriction subunit [Enhydrobacter sp. AX1]|nr:LlaJI family restriction endonuclease [Enhydrobacter sp. AX1]VXB63192.1 Type II restriction-modification system restriction subunit [Enhydrobacter sp. AX1]